MSDVIIRSSNLKNLVVGNVTARWNAAGTKILRYYLDVRHTKMNLHRELSAPEIFILQNKVDALIAAWDEKWAQHQLREMLQSGKQSAEDLSIAAQMRLDGLQRILAATLTVNDTVDWESLKDHSVYPMPKSFPQAAPKFYETPPPVYAEPKISFWSKILGKAASLTAQAQAQYKDALTQWKDEQAKRREEFDSTKLSWQSAHDHFWADHEGKRRRFMEEQAAANSRVDALKSSVARGDGEAVIEHSSLVLDNSNYDGFFEKSFDIQYRSSEKLLMVSYDLPSPDMLPTVKSVKFLKGSGELKEVHVSERERKINFESVAYQICLRTIHELFEADICRNIEKVLFNGNVSFIDRGTGQEARSCLLSVIVDRSVFENIDLARVEPRACFKSLKGVSAASLAALTPIAPVIDMNKEDRRFIEGRAVGAELDDSTNLASISWEDFEHLVREVFEQEFRSRGGEVKVTRASSDGGVDAVAFDPDPISGGKIVIQAKRYTRTVGVSAVRDLYGTVMNEGASKGILVTTADYGPDAYQFANGKPLTLLNGANLLHMLEKHGYRARIDLREARAAMG